MAGPVLYSTNCYLKLYLQEKYAGDIHHVWCSEVFDPTKSAGYSASFGVAPSSSPAGIYRRLREDVMAEDKHSPKIIEQRTAFEARAVEWHKAGKINDADKEDIIYLVKNFTFGSFRPLIYVIPRAAVDWRLKPVAAAARAAIGPEYILADLKRSEFDVIEVPYP